MLDAKLTTAFHSQADDQIEVVNKSIKNLLLTLVIEHNDLKLSFAEFAYNSSVNRITSKSA